MVEFVKLQRMCEMYSSEYEEAVLKAMRSGWYVLGNELAEFEKAFADYLK